MDGLQPDSYSTGNPQINFQFHLLLDDQQVAGYLFKSWDIDTFQPQNPYSALVAYDITSTRTAVDEVPDRSGDATLVVGDTISTWGMATKNPLKLFLDGFLFFEGWVDAENGIVPTQLSGTWTQTF